MKTHSPASAIIIGILIGALLAMAGCSVNPATGESHFNFIGEDREIDMGRQSDQEVVASMGIYQDAAVQQYVTDLGMRLAARCERPNLPWTFRVIDDPMVNAFAIPGGFIYITRGILTHLNSEAELAGVMGHEIGHVTAKHSVNRMATQQIAQLGLGIGMMVKPELQEYAGLAGQGLQLLFLKFSRDDESQADALGVRYMNRLGNDPRQLISVMAMLDGVMKASGSGNVPEWSQTHPAPVNREKDIAAEIDTIRNPPLGKIVNADSYMKKIDGLVYGDDPREGFFRGNTFYQPTMKFRFDFPEGWTTSNQKQAVGAVSPKQDAILQISLAAEKSAAAAAQAFKSQQGMTAGTMNAGTVHGFSTASQTFSVAGDQGTVEGLATFVEFGGSVMKILAYTAKGGWSSYQTAVTKAVSTFDKVTDPSLLNVQPKRVKVITLQRAMSLDAFNKQYPSSISVDELALINQVDRGAVLKAGSMVKCVNGGK